MRCGLERMNARRGAPAMVIPWPSGATPQSPFQTATRRGQAMRAQRRVAARRRGMTTVSSPRLALHPVWFGRMVCLLLK
jgi:hypothetical protein